MELLDLCPLEIWMALEEEIYSTSQLNPAVYNTKGIRIHRNHRWPNRLCPEIKAIPKGQSFICATAHMNLANMAKNSRRPVIEECDAGMVKLLVPVIVDDMYLGSVGGCGKVFEGGEVDIYLVNKITGMEEDKVEALAGEVPSITMEHSRELADFIQGRIGEIVGAFLDRERNRSGRS